VPSFPALSFLPVVKSTDMLLVPQPLSPFYLSRQKSSMCQNKGQVKKLQRTKCFTERSYWTIVRKKSATPKCKKTNSWNISTNG
jgi:hypothetical protein